MKTLTTLALLCLTVPQVSAQEKDLADEMLGFMQKLLKTVKGIKDKETAEKATPELKALATQYKELETQFRKLPPNKQREINQKHRDAGKKLSQQLNEEVQRIAKVPEAMKVLAKVFPNLDRSKANVAIAKAQIQTILRAVQFYTINEGAPPDTLEMLVKKSPTGRPPVLANKKALVDPWGRPYKYDPKGPRNNGSKPDIWSLGPSGKKETIIGNWPAEKKPEK